LGKVCQRFSCGYELEKNLEKVACDYPEWSVLEFSWKQKWVAFQDFCSQFKSLCPVGGVFVEHPCGVLSPFIEADQLDEDIVDGCKNGSAGERSVEVRAFVSASGVM
jgi:hypothetical protein